MYDDILIPTDGTPVATRALEAVLPLATAVDARIHALHVVDLASVSPSLREVAADGLTDQATRHVEAVATAARADDLEAETAVLETADPIHDAIVSYAIDHGIDCIAMGTRAPTGFERMTMGSVTRRTVRTAPIPVLTVTPAATVGALEHVLLPTDGSDPATAAATQAVELSVALDASLHVINVVDTSGPWATLESSELLVAFEAAGREAVDAVIEQADDRGVRSIQSSVLEGTPAEMIIEYASDHDIDAAVMGTHGRTGLDRMLLGSVTEAVISGADIPVLSVKDR